MSRRREAQWTSRLRHLEELRARFATAGRYDRAHRAFLVVKRVYERWAHEVFAPGRR